MKAKKFTGSHDICHCSNDNCPSKMTCRRYVAHLDAVERKLEYVSYFIIDDRFKMNGDKCESYWEYE
jgi:hypothetical protein